MQDALELFYESVKLHLRAQKASIPAQRDALHAKWYDMLHRVLRVDPSLMEAQYNLGNMYYKGKGVQQDFKQAAAWYQKAAEQGFAEAQINLGYMYDEGKGVQQDFKQAAAWYQKAADQGDTMAHLGLAVLSKWLVITKQPLQVTDLPPQGRHQIVTRLVLGCAGALSRWQRAGRMLRTWCQQENEYS
jgi:TPR repeat protein